MRAPRIPLDGRGWNGNSTVNLFQRGYKALR
jgi:hypothetical protein